MFLQRPAKKAGAGGVKHARERRAMRRVYRLTEPFDAAPFFLLRLLCRAGL